MSAADRFDHITIIAKGEAAAKRLADSRHAQAEGMRRLSVVLNGKPLGSVRMEMLPDFCACITGGPRP